MKEEWTEHLDGDLLLETLLHEEFAKRVEASLAKTREMKRETITDVQYVLGTGSRIYETVHVCSEMSSEVPDHIRLLNKDIFNDEIRKKCRKIGRTYRVEFPSDDEIIPPCELNDESIYLQVIGMYTHVGCTMTERMMANEPWRTHLWMSYDDLERSLDHYWNGPLLDVGKTKLTFPGFRPIEIILAVDDITKRPILILYQALPGVTEVRMTEEEFYQKRNLADRVTTLNPQPFKDFYCRAGFRAYRAFYPFTRTAQKEIRKFGHSFKVIKEVNDAALI
ncbi:MAG: hypothetical protein ABIH34_02290 [Nanoarchaeota archaeon]